MALEKAKEILKRLHDKFGEDLKYAKTDIRPDYSGLGINGYSYHGIENNDKDFIYSAISSLGVSVNDAYGPIVFDVEHVFVTDKKALTELKNLKKFIENDLEKLKALKAKYQDKECSHYPIEVCLDYHQQVNDILDEVLYSDEVRVFENPKTFSDLKNENDQLRFQLYWSKRKWKYIIHLIAFFPFIAICVVLLFHKEKKDLVGLSNWVVLIITGLITIAFNLFFNNHNSFKNAWKLLTRNGKTKLKDKEKADFVKTRHIIVFLLVSLATGCNFLDNKTGAKKDFYNTIAGWDIKHVPIIPPFRASSTYPGQWLINGSKEILHLGKNRGGDIPVNSFGVSKNYIYGKTENGRWFLFNIYSLVYSEYSTEAELVETLKLLKLDKNQIESCEKYFQELSNDKRCYWYPKIDEDYPKFEDYQPPKKYTILVDGNEKVTDFKVKETIKKTVTKLYYFNVKYDNEKNDLFYVSFDYSPPKLIDNKTIYAAYCEDNVSLNISVYTPFPVGQSKGIDEKDRVVLSKQIELK